MNRIIALIIILFFIACDNEQKKPSKNSNFRLEFVKRDSIKTDSTLRPLYFRSQYLWNSNKLVHSNGPDKLVVLDLNNNKIEKTINFKKDGEDNVNKANLNFYYHNKDSIFLISNQKKFYRTNDEAEIVNSFRFDSISDLSNEFGEPMVSMGTSNAVFRNSKLSFITYPQSPENMNKSVDDPVFATLDLKNKKLNESGLRYSYSVQYDKLQHPYFIEPLATKNNNDDLIILFKTDNHFIVIEDNEIKNKIGFKSDYFFEYPKMKGREEIPTFPIESFSNQKLLFDQVNEKYYLFISHYMDYKNSTTGNVNTTYHKPFSILIFDDNFNKILERKFKGEKYNMHMSFISKNGLYLSLNNVENDVDFEDDFFKYEIYDLKQNE